MPGAPEVPLGGIYCDKHGLGILASPLMTGGSALVCEKAEGGQHLADAV